MSDPWRRDPGRREVVSTEGSRRDEDEGCVGVVNTARIVRRWQAGPEDSPMRKGKVAGQRLSATVCVKARMRLSRSCRRPGGKHTGLEGQRRVLCRLLVLHGVWLIGLLLGSRLHFLIWELHAAGLHNWPGSDATLRKVDEHKEVTNDAVHSSIKQTCGTRTGNKLDTTKTRVGNRPSTKTLKRQQGKNTTTECTFRLHARGRKHKITYAQTFQMWPWEQGTQAEDKLKAGTRKS